MSVPLAQLPPHERPRERCLNEGPHALEPEELLALLLGTGRGSAEDALLLGRRVLDELDGVEGLAGADLKRLLSIKGIGPVKATRIRAAFELSWRTNSFDPPLPAVPPEDPFDIEVRRLRGQVPTGASTVLAHRPGTDHEPVTLVVAQALEPGVAAGSMLSQILQTGPGPWWVVSVRPGGAPTTEELQAGQRLLVAAELLMMDLREIVYLGSSGAWTLPERP